MLSSKVKDLKIRHAFYKKELLKRKIKFLFINSLNKELAYTKGRNFSSFLKFFVFKGSRRISKTKIVRRCVLTNRARVSVRKYGISRPILRELFQNGVIPGYIKAVW
jgi:ribosomal protein S14